MDTCRKWQMVKDSLDKHSASRKDGISLKLEASTRRIALAFIQDVGSGLKMNQYTIATAMTFWQRFFLCQSLRKNDNLLVASACILLAGKVEENFKSIQKVAEMSHFIRCNRDIKSIEKFKHDHMSLLAAAGLIAKAESLLMRTLDFDFTTSHPHAPLWRLMVAMGLDRANDPVLETFRKVAWSLANDSLRTQLCVQPYSSLEIAVACIALASTRPSCFIPSLAAAQHPWWTKYITKDSLYDIESQILNLYKSKSGEASRDSQSMASSWILKQMPSDAIISPMTGSVHDVRAELSLSQNQNYVVEAMEISDQIVDG